MRTQISVWFTGHGPGLEFGDTLNHDHRFLEIFRENDRRILLNGKGNRFMIKLQKSVKTHEAV